jgi:hypothetical protein
MPESIFTTQIPDSVGTETGGGTCQGTIFTTAVPGYVTGIRWYGPSPVPTVAPIGLLYRWDTDTTGAELARATFGTITASDWNTVLFASPVAIVPGQRYVAATWSKDQYVFKAHIHDTDIVSGNLTAPSTGTSGNAKFHNATATPVYPDGLTGGNNFGLFGDVLFTAALIPQGSRRRIVAPRASRARMTVPVRAQLNPPYPVAEIVQSRRLRGLLPRRARLAQPVPAQVVVVPPAFVPQPSRAPGRRVLFQRRGRAAVPVPPQQTVVPPVWLPPPVRARVRLAALRRSRPTPIPPVDVPPPAARSARRPWLARLRRSAPARVPDAVIAPTPKLIPVTTGRRRPLAWLQRRRSAQPPLPISATATVRDLVLTVGQPTPKWTAGPPTTRWRTDDPRTRWTPSAPTTRWATKDPAVNTTAGPPRT